MTYEAEVRQLIEDQLYDLDHLTIVEDFGLEDDVAASIMAAYIKKVTEIVENLG